MALEVSNVKMVDHGHLYGDHEYTNIALSWNAGGARFHIWLNDAGTLYKNAPLKEDGTPLKRDEPGYFETRKLNPNSKDNARMIEKAKQIAEAEGLREKAAGVKRQERDARDAEIRAARAVHLKREASAELYAALVELVRCVRGGDATAGVTMDDALIGASDAIRKADGLG